MILTINFIALDCLSSGTILDTLFGFESRPRYRKKEPKTYLEGKIIFLMVQGFLYIFFACYSGGGHFVE